MGTFILFSSSICSDSYIYIGNVSHVVPSFHGVFGITTPPNIPGHHPEFAKAAALDGAHAEAILSAKAMAMIGWNVLAQAKE